MKNIQRNIHTMFHRPETRLFVIANDILAVMTLVSVLALALDTVAHLEPYHELFLVIEYIAVFFFTLEYIGRIYIAENKKHYLFSVFGIIDLLAIVPSYLLLTNLSFLKSARVLHVVRFLRMMRLVKVLHSRERQHGTFRRITHLPAFNTVNYFFFLFSSVTLLGTLLYAFEGPVREGARSIPEAMIWVSQVIFGGVSHLTPETVWGDVVIIGTRFTGLLLFGFLIHIVGEYINQYFFGQAHFETMPTKKPRKQRRKKKYTQKT